MDIQDLLSSPALQTAAGVLATVGLGYAFDRFSGAQDIARNSGNIERAARNYAEQIGLDINQIASGSIQANHMRSLMIVNAEEAAITLREDDHIQRCHVRLDEESGRVALAQARQKLDQPDNIAAIFSKQIVLHDIDQTQRRAANRDSRTWTRPTGLQTMWALVARDKAYASRAARIEGALNLTAKVLVASPERNIDLSGACHIALKITDAERNRADIIVMPTTKIEAQLIRDLAAGQVHYEGDNKDAHFVRQKLAALHT